MGPLQVIETVAQEYGLHPIMQDDNSQVKVLNPAKPQITSTIVDDREDFLWDDAGTLCLSDSSSKVCGSDDDDNERWTFKDSMISPDAEAIGYMSITDSYTRRPPLPDFTSGRVVYNQLQKEGSKSPTYLNPLATEIPANNLPDEMYAKLSLPQSRPQSKVTIDEQEMLGEAGSAPELPDRVYGVISSQPRLNSGEQHLNALHSESELHGSRLKPENQTIYSVAYSDTGTAFSAGAMDSHSVGSPNSPANSPENLGSLHTYLIPTPSGGLDGSDDSDEIIPDRAEPSPLYTRASPSITIFDRLATNGSVRSEPEYGKASPSRSPVALLCVHDC